MNSGRNTNAGRRLLLARVAWLAVACLAVGLFIQGLPIYYRQIQNVCAVEPCPNSLTPEDASALAAVGLTVEFAAGYFVALDVLTALVFGAVAAAIFWRRSDDGMALFVALSLLTFGFFGIHGLAKVAGILAQVHPFWQAPVYLLTFLSAASFTLFYFVFPGGHFAPSWLRGVAAFWVISQAVSIFLPNTLLNPDRWPALLNVLYWGSLFVTCIYAQVYRYRHVSNHQQRQQTKWVVLGIVLALGGAAAAYALTSLAPALGPQWAPLGLAQQTSYYPFVLLVPISIGVAILRSGLWDIDVVINRALVYSLVTGVLALLYAGFVILFQALFQLVTGPMPDVASVVSTLAIVALFQPLRRKVQAVVDRRFYRRKYDAQQVLAGFAGTLREEVDLDRLRLALPSVAEETMQPAHVTLWLKGEPARRRAAGSDLDR